MKRKTVKRKFNQMIRSVLSLALTTAMVIGSIQIPVNASEVETQGAYETPNAVGATLQNLKIQSVEGMEINPLELNITVGCEKKIKVVGDSDGAGLSETVVSAEDDKVIVTRDQDANGNETGFYKLTAGAAPAGPVTITVKRAGDDTYAEEKIELAVTVVPKGTLTTMFDRTGLEDLDNDGQGDVVAVLEESPQSLPVLKDNDGVSVVYASDDDAKVEVFPGGNIEAKGVGKATITATFSKPEFEDKEEKITVYVVNRPTVEIISPVETQDYRPQGIGVTVKISGLNSDAKPKDGENYGIVQLIGKDGAVLKNGANAIEKTVSLTDITGTEGSLELPQFVFHVGSNINPAKVIKAKFIPSQEMKSIYAGALSEDSTIDVVRAKPVITANKESVQTGYGNKIEVSDIFKEETGVALQFVECKEDGTEITVDEERKLEITETVVKYSPNSQVVVTYSPNPQVAGEEVTYLKAKAKDSANYTDDAAIIMIRIVRLEPQIRFVIEPAGTSEDNSEVNLKAEILNVPEYVPDVGDYGTASFEYKEQGSVEEFKEIDATSNDINLVKTDGILRMEFKCPNGILAADKSYDFKVVYSGSSWHVGTEAVIENYGIWKTAPIIEVKDDKGDDVASLNMIYGKNAKLKSDVDYGSSKEPDKEKNKVTYSVSKADWQYINIEGAIVNDETDTYELTTDGEVTVSQLKTTLKPVYLRVDRKGDAAFNQADTISIPCMVKAPGLAEADLLIDGKEIKKEGWYNATTNPKDQPRLSINSESTVYNRIRWATEKEGNDFKWSSWLKTYDILNGIYEGEKRIRVQGGVIDTNGVERVVSSDIVILESIKVDTVLPKNPTVTVKPETPDGKDDWYIGNNPSITIAYPDVSAETSNPITVHYIWSVKGSVGGEYKVLEEREFEKTKEEILAPEIKENGVYKLEVYTVDAAGNESQRETTEYKVNTVKPEIESVTYQDNWFKKFANVISKAITKGEKVLFSEETTVEVKFTVGISGLKACYVSDTVGEDSWEKIEEKLEPNKVGKYTYSYSLKNDKEVEFAFKVLDNAGNEITTDAKTNLLLDTVEPNIEVTASSNGSNSERVNNDAGYWTNGDVTLDIAFTNSSAVVSGLNYIEYRSIDAKDETKFDESHKWKILESPKKPNEPNDSGENIGKGETPIEFNEEYAELLEGESFNKDENKKTEDILLKEGEKLYIPNQITIKTDVNRTYQFRAVTNSGITSEVHEKIVKIQKTPPENGTVTVTTSEGEKIKPKTDTEWYNLVDCIGEDPKVYPKMEVAAPIMAEGYEYRAAISLFYKLQTINEAGEDVESIPKGQIKLGSEDVLKQPKLPSDGRFKLSVWTTDEAGNSSSEEVEHIFQVDTENPELDVTYKNNWFKKLLNSVTFGHFFAENVTVTAKASDDKPTSGIKDRSYVFYLDGKPLEENKNENIPNKECSVEIKPGNKGYVTAIVSDNAGNVSTETSENKNNKHIVVDSAKPQIKVKLETVNEENQKANLDSEKWTNQDVLISLSEDKDKKVLSGISYYEYQYVNEGEVLNGEDANNWTPLTSKVKSPEKDFTISADKSEVFIDTALADTGGIAEEMEKDAPNMQRKDISYEGEDGKYYLANQLRISKDINAEFKFRAVSNTGIKGVVQSVIVRRDTVAPILEESYVEGDAPSGGLKDKEGNIKEPWYNLSDFLKRGKNYPVMNLQYPDYKEHTAPITLMYEWTKMDGSREANEFTKTAVDNHEKIIPPKIEGDGIFKLSIAAKDEAGNKAKVIDDLTVRVDASLPTAEVTTGSNKWNSLLNKFTFGLFYKDTTEISVSSDFNISGRKSLQYIKAKDELVKSELEASKKWVEFDENGKADRYFVSPNEKFITYVKTTDVAGNVNYISSNGIIVDDQAPPITITPERQPNGDNFYNSDVPIHFAINDPDYWEGKADNVSGIHSGLKEVHCEVLSDGNVTQRADYDLSKENPTYGELVKDFSNTMVVSAVQNNSNNIEVRVTAVDNVGNRSVKSHKLSIDITNPVVEITYDNNTPTNDKYYNGDRVATIHVTERNFKPEYIDYNILNNGQSANHMGTAVGWVSNGEEHYANIVFHEDADYSVTMEMKDMADNRSSYGRNDEFTIDQTIPTIQVTYNNNEAREGEYYKADRTATIQVTEHNFEPGSIRVTSSATENGAGVGTPGISGWSASGDVHTATITYGSDAHYTFSIAYTDMANNAAAAFAEQRFVVDKTKPELTISGLKHESANNEEKIGFSIKSSDNNYGDITPKLSALVRSKDGAFETIELPVGAETGTGNERVYTVDNLEQDGIYKLSCVLKDKAGNICDKVKLEDKDGKVFEEKIYSGTDADTLLEFSVNREGSTYRVLLSPTDLNNKITNEDTEDIKVSIEEINVDELTENATRLDLYNGLQAKKVALKRGVNYQAGFIQGEGGWKKYVYTLAGDNFTDDGNYKVGVYSVDKAGNESDSAIKDKAKAKVEFIVDRTKPEMSVNVEDRATYNQIDKTVELNVAELHMEKDSIEVSVDDQKLKVGNEITDLGNGQYEFTLKSGINQNIIITCRDRAGNTNELLVQRVTVSTNVAVRAWAVVLNNMAASVTGSVAAVGAIGAGSTAMIRKRKRRRLKFDE